MIKILVVQIGAGFRTPNKHLVTHLQSCYPDNEIQLIDLLEIVKKNPIIIVVNLFCMMWEYSSDFFVGNKRIYRLHHYYLGTSYLFRFFSRMVSNQVMKEDYKFIIQTQGLCDSSNPKGIPFYIYTDHTNRNNLNYPYANSKVSMHSREHQKLEAQAYENAKMIFVMSTNIRASLINQYNIDPAKIKLVYAGANAPYSDVPKPKAYTSKNIAFVGKDWKRKGGPLLIEAFKIVLQTVPDATLSIAGCKPKGINVPNCKVYGEVSLDEVAQIYAHASVFCMPTTLEPFGIVFLEAMVNCLPIVTNDIGATADFVINDFNGYRLHNDAHEYAKVLIRLLQDPEQCKSFGANSCQLVKQNYTWNNVAALMSSYINQETTE